MDQQDITDFSGPNPRVGGLTPGVAQAGAIANQDYIEPNIEPNLLRDM